jgi:hypothetical protein
MERSRSARSVRWTRALVLGAVLGGADVNCAGSKALNAHSTAPGVLRPVHSLALVTWVLRAEDCLSCRTPASVLRRVAGRYAPNVEVSVLLVGTDDRLVYDYLAAERLPAQVKRISKARYRAEFGNSPLPALYVVRGDTIVATWAKTSPASESEILRSVEESVGTQSQPN